MDMTIMVRGKGYVRISITYKYSCVLIGFGYYLSWSDNIYILLCILLVDYHIII